MPTKENGMKRKRKRFKVHIHMWLYVCLIQECAYLFWKLTRHTSLMRVRSKFQSYNRIGELEGTSWNCWNIIGKLNILTPPIRWLYICVPISSSCFNDCPLPKQHALSLVLRWSHWVFRHGPHGLLEVLMVVMLHSTHSSHMPQTCTWL